MCYVLIISSFLHSFTHSLRSFFHSFTPFIPSFIHSLTHSLHSFIHSFVHDLRERGILACPERRQQDDGHAELGRSLAVRRSNESSWGLFGDWQHHGSAKSARVTSTGQSQVHVIVQVQLDFDFGRCLRFRAGRIGRIRIGRLEWC